MATKRSAKQVVGKSTSAKPQRGRAATGNDPLMGFRAAPAMRAMIVRWAENQPDTPSLPEAVRRLVGLGLEKKQQKYPRVLSTSREGAARAAELAAKTLDTHLGRDMPVAERETRKRKLLQGPSTFRGVRKDRSR
jgi:hypothetical protein